MDALADKFLKMGARAVVEAISPRDQRLRFRVPPTLAVDIRSDRHGEFFHVRRPADVKVDVIDLRPRERHLLLMARNEGRAVVGPQKSKFLCGHDERHWFVAAVPEKTRGVSNVQQAMDALKPQAVWNAIARHGVMAQRNLRRTAAFVRQGEWFFLPRPDLVFQANRVLKNEPLRRGAGKPHWCDQLVRDGGEMVRVCAAYPNGLTESEYRALDEQTRKRHRWTAMARDARPFVRGRVRHPDHETIVLDVWHEVVMNTETQAFAMRNVAFLD
ncbi:MAG: hypothetical protein QM770_21545 [Tepidisphaeraceae bacterium]